MSDAISALNNAAFEGEITVRDAGLRGMITLRGDLADAALQEAATGITGMAIPDRRAINMGGTTGLAWMSPDELLVMLPYAQAAAAVSQLDAALAGKPHLVANVSDARAVIALEGAGLREVLAKGAPADLRPSKFEPGEVRRTRLGQVAIAFWLIDETRAELVCFRSVAGFVFDWLRVSARPGSLPGHLS
jgi:sarcosine oxidase, subunit gamma